MPKETQENVPKSRGEDIDGLIKNERFEVMNASNVREGIKMFRSKLIDIITTASAGIRCRSWLVLQSYGDKEFARIATKVTTIHLFTQRIALLTVASFDQMSTHTREIKYAYENSQKFSERVAYISPPVKINLPSNMILRLYNLCIVDVNRGFTGTWHT